MIKPMFSIRPKTFDPIDMISSFRFSLFFADCYMLATDIEESIRMPIIGVEKTPWFSMYLHQWFQLLFTSPGNGKGQHPSIALVHTEHHVFSSGTPSSLTGYFTTKQSLVHLDCTGQGNQFFHAMQIDTSSENSKPALNRFPIKGNLKPESIHRNAQAEIFDKSSFPVWRNPGRIPDRPIIYSSETASGTPVLTSF